MAYALGIWLLLLLLKTACFSSLTIMSNDETNSNITPKSIPLRLVYLTFPEHNEVLNGAGTYPMRDILVDSVNANLSILRNYNVTINTYNTEYNLDANVAKSIRFFAKYVASDCSENSHQPNLVDKNRVSSVLLSTCISTNVSKTSECINATLNRMEKEEGQEESHSSSSFHTAPFFYGPEYSAEARIIGQLAPLYNLVQIASEAIAVDLSDREKYPNFFRTIITAGAFVTVPRAIAQYFNFTTVALLQRDDQYAEQMPNIEYDLASHGINVLFRVVFKISKLNNDSIDQMLDTTALYDARILIVWSNDNDEQRIFCRTLDRWQTRFSSDKFLLVFLSKARDLPGFDPDEPALLPNCPPQVVSRMLNGSLLVRSRFWGLPGDQNDFGYTNRDLMLKAEQLGRTRYGHPTGWLARPLPRIVDALWLGFLALDALDRRLQAETPPRSLLDFTFQSADIATMLKQEVLRTKFNGAGGPFKFDATGNVDTPLYVEQYRPERPVTDAYTSVLKLDFLKVTAEPTGETMKFGTKTGDPPPDKKPISNANGSNSMLILLSVLLSAFGALAAVAGLVLYRLFQRRARWQLEHPVWLVDWKDLVLENDSRSLKDSSSFGASTTAASSAKNVNDIGITRLAQLHNSNVNMQPMPASARQLTIDVHNHKLLTALRNTLQHDNIVQFVGYCRSVASAAVPPASLQSAEQFVLWQHCEKGSLEQLIDNGALVTIDTLLEYAIMLDIANGMAFLHRSFLQAHGALCPAACLIDKRFSVKVADYADQPLAEVFGLTSLKFSSVTASNKHHISEELLPYLAPELLRTVPDVAEKRKSQAAADIYAYAMTIFQLKSRNPCYDTSAQTMDEILQLVAQIVQIQPPFRPAVSTLPPSVDKRLTQLIQQCWAEVPGERPAFRDIVRHLQQISGVQANSSVTDQLLARLERYASDMESLVHERTEELVVEKRRSDALLEAMLPAEIASELKRSGHVQPESFDSVSVYFSDIAGFTTISSDSTPMEVVKFLNALYTMFDARIDVYDAYKVETIGDAYMVVSGLPRRNGNLHAVEIAKLSLALLDDIRTFRIPHRPHDALQLRIGLHTGPCVAGVVGTKMPRYCLFGDTVNTASRMESNGQRKIFL